MDKKTKNCPYCGEEIKAEAIKCRYCKEFIDEDKSMNSNIQYNQTLNQNYENNSVSIFSSEGRANRLEFFAYFLISFFIMVVGYVMVYTNETLIALFGLIVVIFGAIVSFMISVKRLHDLNYSGWYMLLNFIPIASLILFIYLLLAPGIKGVNRYGVET